MAFSFGAGADIVWVRDQLLRRFGAPCLTAARDPIGQLVKSAISGRTRDAVSLAAYERLVATYRGWSDLAAAPACDVQGVIGDVTFPEVKARHLGRMLRAIEARHPDFDLDFLGRKTVEQALDWLETMPGVGRKVSASTLNFSTLEMPAFVVDAHVLRILRRFGFVRRAAETRTAYTAVMAMTEGWSAADLAQLHMLMKHLGQVTCHSNGARCRDCPIGGRCKAASGSRGAKSPEAAGPAEIWSG